MMKSRFDVIAKVNQQLAVEFKLLEQQYHSAAMLGEITNPEDALFSTAITTLADSMAALEELLATNQKTAVDTKRRGK